MTFDTLWRFDSFFWLIVPIAILEAVRAMRTSMSLGRNRLQIAISFGLFDALSLTACAGTNSPSLFVCLGVLRALTRSVLDRQVWTRGLIKVGLVALAFAALGFGGVDSFADVAVAAHDLSPGFRMVVFSLLCGACVAAIVPVHISDEAKQTLVSPFVLVAFARVALPLSAADTRIAAIGPILAAALGAVCALWLLSAGMRANHFEHSTLVSEILMCERGVLLSFVWLGLASSERLAGVGALLEWWSSALALLTLEASLRVKVLPKPMAFFALAMAVGLPGTTGFIAEDLLAHGLLELRPALAAAFVCVSAVNAVALYLALVNIIVDVGPRGRREPRLSAMMILPAALSIIVGVVPRPFVASAVDARIAVAPIEQHGSVHATTH